MALRTQGVIVVVLFIGSLALTAEADARGRRALRRVVQPVASRAAEAPASTLPATGPALPVVVPQIDPRQAMADIMSLRQAQGQGDAEASAAFSDALQRLIAEKHGEPIAPVVAASATEPAPSLIPSAVAGSADLVPALRQSAAHFDARANAFEAQKDYSAADSARQTAEQLRREARRLDP